MDTRTHRLHHPLVGAFLATTTHYLALVCRSPFHITISSSHGTMSLLPSRCTAIIAFVRRRNPDRATYELPFHCLVFRFFTKAGTKVILDPCKTMDIGTGTFRINLTVARALLCFPCVPRIAPSSLCVCKALAFSSIDLCFPSLVFFVATGSSKRS